MMRDGVTFNGQVRAGGAAAPAGSGRVWVIIVFGLLAMNAGIVGATVYLAASDGSVATEPDYYAKAIDFERTIRLREASARLGWSAEPSLSGGVGGGMAELVVAFKGRDGRAVPGAEVRVVAFSNVRSGDRQSLVLRPVGSEPGVYGAPIRLDRAGIWNLRITAVRGDDTFVHETELSAAD